MGRPDPTFLVVGHLSKPHGTQGEMYVSPLTDHPEGVFAPGVVLLMGGAADDEPDPDLPPLRVDAVRPFRNGFLIFFGGVETRSQADRLRGGYLFRRLEDLEPLADGEFFYHQLLGLTVRTVSGDLLGTVTEVFDVEPAHLLEVRGPEREHILPFLVHIVISVDIEAGTVVVDPPDGLLEL